MGLRIERCEAIRLITSEMLALNVAEGARKGGGCLEICGMAQTYRLLLLPSTLSQSMATRFVCEVLREWNLAYLSEVCMPLQQCTATSAEAKMCTSAPWPGVWTGNLEEGFTGVLPVNV